MHCTKTGSTNRFIVCHKIKRFSCLLSVTRLNTFPVWPYCCAAVTFYERILCPAMRSDLLDMTTWLSPKRECIAFCYWSWKMHLLPTVKISLKNKNQLGFTCYFIVLLIGSTCFGHDYAHHRELATMMLITTLVVSFLVCCMLDVRCSWAGVVSGLPYQGGRDVWDIRHIVWIKKYIYIYMVDKMHLWRSLK